MTCSYTTALHKLTGKIPKGREIKNENLIPFWAKSADFMQTFVPYVTIIGDSREQKDWIETACKTYNIGFEKAVKNKSNNTENLKEGDYTFKIDIGKLSISYLNEVAYERKGSLSELYNNCKGNDRERIEREFNRFIDKKYKKVVLLIEVGKNLLDLVDKAFRYPIGYNKWETKNVGNTIFTSLMSWKQPNNKDFEIIQSDKHIELFWLMLLDMFYYFRADVKKRGKLCS